MTIQVSTTIEDRFVSRFFLGKGGQGQWIVSSAQSSIQCLRSFGKQAGSGMDPEVEYRETLVV